MSQKLKLNSIEEEAKACRNAFEGVQIGALVIHCHHEILSEILTQPAEDRIFCILSVKLEHEKALRLRLFRPVNQKHLPRELQKAYLDWQVANAVRHKAAADILVTYAVWEKACAVYDKATAVWVKAAAVWLNKIHARICKNCPWDGSTIFPE